MDTQLKATNIQSTPKYNRIFASNVQDALNELADKIYNVSNNNVISVNGKTGAVKLTPEYFAPSWSNYTTDTGITDVYNGVSTIKHSGWLIIESKSNADCTCTISTADSATKMMAETQNGKSMALMVFKGMTVKVWAPQGFVVNKIVYFKGEV